MLSWIGLPGVYIGTIVCRLVELVIRPNILFKKKLNMSPAIYYLRFIKYLAIVIIPINILKFFSNLVMSKITIIRFLIMIILMTIVANVFWYFIYRKTEEFQWVFERVKLIFNHANKKLYKVQKNCRMED